MHSLWETATIGHKISSNFLLRFNAFSMGDGHNRPQNQLKFPAEIQCIRSEEHTSELQSRSDLVCRLLLEKKKRLHVDHIDVPYRRLTVGRRAGPGVRPAIAGWAGAYDAGVIQVRTRIYLAKRPLSGDCGHDT